ncbi:hypothetical protein [uncultured Rheinheimera sp.]|jgi:hypothetical protein|uniref:hypothetical protein n=1 Tax=uncultured Rheinheimera sp. TaxID=400532 RepID=UPI0025977370|nr:hypothetical protein [uncultured Rheinheimera sp.]
MKLSRCPVCHSNIHLDQLVQDEAGRQLLGLVSKLGYQLGPALVAYLGLFRPEKRDLTNDRALSLAQETLALTANQPLLAESLRETVTGIQNNRIRGDKKALANHNYLKRVMEAKAGAEPVKPVKSSIELKQDTQISAEENNRLFQERMKQLGGRDIRGAT